MSITDESRPQAQRVPLGGDYWQAQPGTDLWGFADLHAHLMAHTSFGGNGFWGKVYDEDHPGEEGLQYALPSCEPVHGGLINANPEFGHPAGGGWPDFIIWPRFTTLVHQQAYIDWIYRAYQGGLRLITCLAVNNELLGTHTSPFNPTDDRSAIEIQVAAIKETVAFLDRQAGGAGRGWMQIAFTPAEARAIIRDNRLAVVLGVEVDSLGNWRRFEDLQALCQQDVDRPRQLIGDELDWLYGLGVRQITPIHLTDNAFGGTAIYMRFLDAVNVFITGRHYQVEDSWDTGIRYRLDFDGTDVLNDVERLVAVEGESLSPTPSSTRRSLVQHLPGVVDLADALVHTEIGGAHANARGLTVYGIILLQQMMLRGMIIDIDHMSQKATDTALEMAEAHDYPVISSHTWFRDLTFTSAAQFDPRVPGNFGTGDVHKIAHEAGKRADQVERIARLGGIVAPLLNQGDVPDLTHVLPHLAGKVPQPCAGSSTSWAEAYLYAVEKMGGRGVAIGSDINGAAALPGPRFGTFAGYGIRSDRHRVGLRRGQIDRQTNGVRYDEPISDYRWHRFDESGPGAYDKEEREIWQGIAQYHAGFDPRLHHHPHDDSPEVSLSTVDNALHLLFRQDNIDNITKGLWAAQEDEESGQSDPATRWPDEQRAAYLVRRNLEPAESDSEHVREWMRRIKAIWERWQAMEGDNPPLTRSKAGRRRDFDINLDGMAHYGLLPDLLQDMRNQGLAIDDFAPLFRSAEDYVQVWEKCQRRSVAIAAASDERLRR